MAAIDTLPDPPLPELLKRVGFRRRRRGFGSATQLLWNRVESNTSLLELCRIRKDLTDEDETVLKQCQEKLDAACWCLDKPSGRWSFSYWELIHEVDGLLLLVMPASMLVPRALEIQQQFERRVTDSARAQLWLGADRTSGPLPRCVRGLTHVDDPPPLSTEQGRYCRSVLRGALDTVNQQVDKTFWQLSINVSLQIFSTLLLLAVFGISFLLLSRELLQTWPGELIPRGLLLVGFAGASGAIISNMLSKERFLVATGATGRFFAYHLMVKPVIGAFAALMLLFLEQSRMLLSVDTRAGSTGVDPSPALLHIVVSDNQAVFFTLMALSVVAGWSADKLLGSIMDKVLGRLLGQSEKVLPPSSPAGTPPPRAPAPAAR
ncbi:MULTISPECIES: hypothetical protein [unclassified Corallococcus]|uniref:hypothetical protein n=1 Tax=unclassified Corallococcus TaxID=2685029 RepID=UPI001A8EDCCC|nr:MULTISPECIES: hypothetical protein [unclassified Corallococcus]MBN9685538.1 hypothetical protein [Corallococcus sp. NCSPR001]WAS83014.1 hypothetical protein O0N60_27280 [Corallococcus sp. NCRR]